MAAGDTSGWKLLDESTPQPPAAPPASGWKMLPDEPVSPPTANGWTMLPEEAAPTGPQPAGMNQRRGSGSAGYNPPVPGSLAAAPNLETAGRQGLQDIADDAAENPLPGQPQNAPRIGPQILAEEPAAPKPKGPPIMRTFGPTQPGYVAPGHPAPPETAGWKEVGQMLATPVIKPEWVDENLPFLVGPFRLHAGALKAIAGMTSPMTVAIGAATGGAAALASSATGMTAAGLKAGNALLSAYFASGAGIALAKSIPAIGEAVDAGDWQKVLELGGSDVVDAAVAWGAGKHAIEGARQGAVDAKMLAREFGPGGRFGSALPTKSEIAPDVGDMTDEQLIRSYNAGERTQEVAQEVLRRTLKKPTGLPEGQAPIDITQASGEGPAAAPAGGAPTPEESAPEAPPPAAPRSPEAPPPAAPPSPQAPPSPTSVAKGSTFTAPDTGAKFTVNDVADGRVSFTREVEGARPIKATAPLDAFLKMVGQPPVTSINQQPQPEQNQQPPAAQPAEPIPGMAGFAPTEPQSASPSARGPIPSDFFASPGQQTETPVMPGLAGAGATAAANNEAEVIPETAAEQKRRERLQKFYDLGRAIGNGEISVNDAMDLVRKKFAKEWDELAGNDAQKWDELRRKFGIRTPNPPGTIDVQAQQPSQQALAPPQAANNEIPPPLAGFQTSNRLPPQQPSAGNPRGDLAPASYDTGIQTPGLGGISAVPKEAQPVAEPHDFASTQVNLPPTEAQAIKTAGAAIPEDQQTDKGREDQPHITVKYGLHGDEPAPVQEILKDQPPITATLGKASIFKTDDADVLKVDVDSPQLHELNAKIAAALPNTETHPAYQPHVTIAYLKPGQGDQYVGQAIPGVTGQQVTFGSLAFSNKNGEQTEIPLSGTPEAKPEPAGAGATAAANNQPAATAPTAPKQIAIKGDTYPIRASLRDKIKGLQWNKPEKVWVAPDTPENRAAFEQLNKKFPKSKLKIEQYGETPAPTPAPAPAPATGPEALAQAVYEKLKSGGSLGNINEFNKLAEQKLGSGRTEGKWTPKDAFEAMEAGINKLLIERAPELMRMPFEQAMAELRDLMSRITSQGTRTPDQIAKQQFSTPPTEAFLVAKVADVRPTDLVAETSAGNGGLVVWPKGIGAQVYVNEIDPVRASMLRWLGFGEPTAHDGEIIASLADPTIRPTVITINPPFSAGVVKTNEARNKNQYGFNHLDSALQMLAPGGRMVAILGGGRADDLNGGASLNTGPSGKWFEKIAKQYNVRANVRINGKEYQKYGTSFATRVIVIDKNGPTPSQTAKGIKSWDSTVKGHVETLDEAYNLLRNIANDRPEIATRPAGSNGVGQGLPGTGVGAGTGNGVPGPGGVSGPSQGPVQENGQPGGRGGIAGTPGQPAASGGTQPTPLHQPGNGSEGHTPPATVEGAGGGVADNLQERPLGESPVKPSPQDIIDAITKGLGQKLAEREPAPAPKAPAPKRTRGMSADDALRRAGLTPSTGPIAPQPPANPLKAAADAARQALRDKYAKRPDVQGYIPPDLEPVKPAIDPDDLVQLGIIGAEHMVDGVTGWDDWNQKFMQDMGDTVRAIAEGVGEPIDTVLREIHHYASAAAANFGATVETPPAPLALTGKENEGGEEEDSSGYVKYRPKIEGPAHPGDIVETKVMATVPSPAITYKPNLPDSVIKENRLSAVQLEAIAIAGQQNAILMPGGYRGSALIGDGTGVGKGRIAAGYLWDNWRQGRKRLVFVSEKVPLMQDILRDLSGIGANDLLKGVKKERGRFVLESNSSMKALGQFKAPVDIKHEGVLFSTYALIRSEDARGNTRLAQLKKYLMGDDNGEGAAIVFDEAHNLKNAVVGQGGQASQVGIAVRSLLNDIPALRSVSLSATAATDVMNLGYLDRLGLWGPGTPFPSGFQQFASQISGGGMAAMEMIATELKAQGKYLSRTLSYKGVTYDEKEHVLTPEQKEIYRTAARAWQTVFDHVEHTINTVTNGGGRQKARAMSQFYSSQLRFFGVLITSLKTPTVVEAAHQALAEGKSVVITLVNTNEAAQNREKAKVRDAGEEEDQVEYDFGPKEMLVDFIKEHYPTQQFRDDVDASGNPIKVPVTEIDANGRESPRENPEAVRQRDELIAQINRDLHMPQNPLDILVDAFGGDSKVAELTGRKERYDPSTNKFIPRGDPKIPRKDINVVEAKNFQDGKKRVAIVSGAGGTGITLSADRDAINRQVRVQYMLQPGWSADKVMQMFGRTHRSNQIHPPEYVMIVSDLGGEKRFVSTIARRLGSLGALTKGQKSSLGGADLMEKVNFETEQGRQAANSFYQSLLRNSPIPGTEALDEQGNPTGEPLRGMQILTDLHVLKGQAGGGETVPPADRQNVTKLLNRLLALDPDIQNAVYNYFYDMFTASVQDAIDRGTLDTGVKTMPGDDFKIKEHRLISTDPKTGAQTFYYPIEAQVRTNRISPKDLDKRMRERKRENPRVMRDEKGNLSLVIDAQPIVHSDGRIDPASRISRPGNGNWSKVPNYQVRATEVKEWAETAVSAAERKVESAQGYVNRYQDYVTRYGDDSYYKGELKTHQATLAEAQKELADAKSIQEDPEAWIKEEWGRQYGAAPSHNTTEHHLIGGAVLRWWNAIHDVAPRPDIFTALDSQSGKRVVGVDIPAAQIRQLLDRITGAKSTVNAPQLNVDVMRNNLTYRLEGGVQVRRGRVNGRGVLQLIPPNQDIARNLTRLGVLNERGAVPIYYVPNDPASPANAPLANAEVLGRVVEAYPIAPEETPPEVSGYRPWSKTQTTYAASPPSEDYKRGALQRVEQTYADFERLQEEADSAWAEAEAKLAHLPHLRRPTFASVLEPGALNVEKWQHAMSAEDARDAAYAEWKRIYLEPLEEARDTLVRMANNARNPHAARFSSAKRAYSFLREKYAPPEVSGYRPPAEADASRQMPGFYSQLQRTIESKMPEKAPVPQILAILNNPQNGVKQDEIKWTGLRDWVIHQKGTVSKQAVLDYLQANQVRVEEIQHGAKIDQAKVDGIASQLEDAKARLAASATGTVKEGDIAATVGAAASRGGYSYSTGKLYQAVRDRAGTLVWKKAGEFGGTRSGRSDKFLRELQAEAAKLGHRWQERIAQGSAVKGAGEDPAIGQEVATLAESLKRAEEGGKVKYKTEWQFPGGKNKGELILTVPSIEPWETGDEWHFGKETGGKVVAWVRFNDRTGPNGEKILHIEEFQSRRHEVGSHKGYRQDPATVPLVARQVGTGQQLLDVEPPPYWEVTTPDGQFITNVTDPVSETEAITEARRRLAHEPQRTGMAHAVPPAPFSNTWHEIAFRRMLRWAAERGYDQMTWTTGDQQKDRYNLSKQVSRIEYDPENQRLWAYGLHGEDVGLPRKAVGAQELPEYIGKEPAKQLLESPMRRRAGEELTGKPAIHVLYTKDMKVGGEFMNRFYDSTLPAYAAKYGRKWGATVGTTQIDTGPREATYDEWAEQGRPGAQPKKLRNLETVHSISITPAMRESVMQGQPLFNVPAGSLPVAPTTTIAVRLGSDYARARPYERNQPLTFHAGRMVFERLPLSAADAAYASGFVTNMDGMAYILSLCGQHPDQALNFRGLHLSPDNAGIIASMSQSYARSYETVPPGLDYIRQVAKLAAAQNKSLLIVADHADFPEWHKATALREELDHALQSKTSGKSNRYFLGASATWLVQGSEAGREAAATIIRNYGPLETGNLAAEVGVRLMRPNGWQELGITSTQARFLASQYVRALRREYGSTPSAEIARRVFASAEPRGTTRLGGQSRAVPANAGQAVSPERAGVSGPGTGNPRNPAEVEAYKPGETAARLQSLFSNTPQKSDTSESKMGGPGAWVSPKNEVIPVEGENGIQTHGQTAMRITGLKTAPAATAHLLNRGYIRVRGSNVEFQPKAIGSDPLILALDHAAANARQAGEGAVTAEWNGRSAQVPLGEIDEFAANPGHYYRAIGQRGSIHAPILTALPEWIHNQFGAEGPKLNYSGLGSAQTKLKPGGGMSQLKQASPDVFMQAVSAGASSAKATAMMRFGMPAMRKVLEGSGVGYDDMILAYTQSRLDGIQDRWRNFAEQAANLTDEDLPNTLDQHFTHLLSAIENKAGLPQDLGQTAAALAQSKDWDALRDFLEQTFTQAADSVTQVMEGPWFEHVANEIKKNPQVKAAHAIYKKNFEQPMAKNHAQNEGVFSNALGPLDTYYPLIPVDRPAKAAYGKKNPYRKPKNPSNKFATGLSEQYDPSVATFADKLAKTLRANDKAALLTGLEQEGLLQKPNADNVITWRGTEYKSVNVQTAPERSLFIDGKWIHTKATMRAMPSWLNRELAPILEGNGPMNPDLVNKFLNKLNLIALRGPAEAAWHGAGLVGAIVSNTPFLGEGLRDKALSNLFTKKFTALAKLFNIDPTTPENLLKLTEMAQAGALPAKSGKITFSPKFAEETGATLEGWNPTIMGKSVIIPKSLGPALYGPKGFDTRARILMYDIAKICNPNATPQELYEFVNQLGNYTPEFQSEVERALKRWGIGPFITAGGTRVLNGVHAFTGTGPIPDKDASKLIWQLLSGGALMTLAAWMVLHELMTGKMPWNHPGMKFLQIPVTPNGTGWVDKYRHSSLGNALWGDGPETGYIGISMFNPNVERAARFLGIPSAVETLQRGGSKMQSADAATKDVLNSLMHPVLGPGVRAVFVGLTGREAYLTGMRDRYGAPGPQLMTALPKEMKPGFLGGFAPLLSSERTQRKAGAAAEVGARTAEAIRQLNSFYGAVGESTGLLGPDKGQKGLHSLRIAVDLTFPGLVRQPSNPYAARRSVEQQRRSAGQ